MRKTVALCALTLLLVLPAMTTIADEKSPVTGIELSINIGTLNGADRTPVKTYRMVVRDDGSRSEFMSGARIAIPVTRFEVSESGVAAPTTSYTYQNVGFTATSRAWVLDDGNVKLDLGIEQSRVIGDAPPGAQPKIGTRNHSAQVVLKPGVPLVINHSDDPTLGSEYCEVVARIL